MSRKAAIWTCAILLVSVILFFLYAVLLGFLQSGFIFKTKTGKWPDLLLKAYFKYEDSIIDSWNSKKYDHTDIALCCFRTGLLEDTEIGIVEMQNETIYVISESRGLGKLIDLLLAETAESE